MRSFTPSQRKAVETRDRDLCVVAGAGSGKTAVLAERFVQLVLAGKVPVDRILALTFTDKAAVEMRERVGREFAGRGRADLRREAETARISTFHSFCTRLLKENAVEAGIDPSFAVLTGAEASVLKERARDEAFARRMREDRESVAPLARLATGGKDLSEVLAALLDRCRSTGRSFEEIFAGESTPPDLGPPEAALRESLAQLKKDRGEYTDAGLRRADAVLAASAGLAAAGSDPDAVDALLAKVRKAANRTGMKEPASANLLAVQESADAFRTALVGVRAAPVARALASFLAEWEREYAREKGVAPGVVVNRGARADFVDLERLALALLRGSDGVREEVRGSFEHVLVDEFQDTNPVQEALLSLLRREGRTFVVGDPKQAIYGFRGADHRGFARAREAAGERGTIAMRENFRSRPEVLALVNAVLEPAFREGGDAQVPWEPLVAGGAFDAKPVPSTELHLVAGTGKEKKADLLPREAALVADRLRVLVEGGIAITARDADAKAMARPLNWSDAAILLRATTEVKVYERALAERDVPYAVVQGRGFYESREVVDLANLLACVENPRDEVALAAVLRSPFAGLDDDDLLALAGERTRRQGVLADLLDGGRARIRGLEGRGRRRFDRFRAAFARLRELRGRGRLVDVVEAAIEETGFGDAVLLQRNGRQRAANLRKVRESARVFESDGSGGLAEFTGTVRRFRLREERETEAPLAGEDAVALLTVHQAKGLEWPLVFLPDVSRGPGPGAEPVLMEEGEATISLRGPAESLPTPRMEQAKEARKAREAAEGIRVLHVAMTRAKEHLVLTAAEPSDGRRGAWLAAVANAFGDAGLPDGPGRVELPIPEGNGARLLFDRTEAEARAPGRRAVSLFEARRARFLAGRGPGGRTTKATRAAAVAAVARVDSLERVPVDGTPYLSTVSALLDFEACPLRWFWGHRVGIAEREEAIPPRPGDEDEEREAGAERGEHGVPRRITGTAVHAVLGNLDFERDDEARVRAAAAARLREELEEEPPAAAVEEVVGWVKAFRASPLGCEVAEAGRAGRLLREVPFLLKDEGVLLRGQIDLAFRDAAGRWTVADYKASRPPRRRESRSRYERQVHYYVRALRATPAVGATENVRGALVYLDPEPVVVEVEAGPVAREAAGGVLRKFARLTAADEHPPDRRHCLACPYGPKGSGACPEAPSER